MPRTLLLCSGSFGELPFEEFAARSADWGYQGLEVECPSEHLEVQRAVSEPSYCALRVENASRHDLQIPVLNCQRMCLLLADRLDDRHRELAPDYVWGDAQPARVRQRVIEELLATVQVAQKMGVGLIVGGSGSPFGPALIGCLPIPTESVAQAFREYADRIAPILDACHQAGVRFGFVVQPGQLAFDLYTAEILLQAVGGRDEFGFVLDPASLHWQGVDPVEFIHRFPDRIVHVYVNDATLNLNGRSGILNSYLPPGDPRRGWDYRSPGHGGVDWPAIIRALNHAGYDGALSVNWRDAGMHRDYGAEDAARFVRHIDWDRASNSGSPMFQ